MYKKYYSGFLKYNSHIQHMACHSHHFWPDVTREGMLEYWEDSAKLVDHKWNKIFSEKIPTVQKFIAEVLDVDHFENITFAPNTHELAYRLISSLEGQTPTIVTTDSEFYSFNRQIDRLQESGDIKVIKVPTIPFESFPERFLLAIEKNNPEMIFLSHVFFNSGVKIPDALISMICHKKQKESIFVLDGYHSFMATPYSLREVQEQIFFIAGGYKYAQAGEGCCFLYSPPQTKIRPKNTGWFATLGQLDEIKPGSVSFPEDGLRFAGSTMDFSPLYRMEKVFNLFKDKNITVEVIHRHIQFCQKQFLDELEKQNHPQINKKTLIHRDLNDHGHFYTFKVQDNKTAKEITKFLNEHNIIIDSRENLVRFGFGLYHDGNYDLSCLNN